LKNKTTNQNGRFPRPFFRGKSTFCLLRNHYHVALTTPVPNLGDGMHWLQTTFALRFNRFRSERGHLFQGRYQSPLVEDAAALVRVVDYIHLNPVLAGRSRKGSVR
jgi:REP element-mobilizing transposase RayT